MNSQPERTGFEVEIWKDWARLLHRWGMQDWVASFLEAAGPLTLLGAQVIYFGQPWISNRTAAGHLEKLASMLEDQDQTLAFAAFLREVART